VCHDLSFYHAACLLCPRINVHSFPQEKCDEQGLVSVKRLPNDLLCVPFPTVLISQAVGFSSKLITWKKASRDDLCNGRCWETLSYSWTWSCIWKLSDTSSCIWGSFGRYSFTVTILKWQTFWTLSIVSV
jgi:hypothetical protein